MQPQTEEPWKVISGFVTGDLEIAIGELTCLDETDAKQGNPSEGNMPYRSVALSHLCKVVPVCVRSQLVKQGPQRGNNWVFCFSACRVHPIPFHPINLRPFYLI